jgi:guanylate kinase
MSLVYIISAPSGSGKSTLVDRLRKLVPGLDFSVSYTTRAPRGNEENGREYYFVPRSEFEQMVQQNQFLEHAEVFGNYYGTPRESLRRSQESQKDLLLDIDVQGAAQIKEKIPDAVSIFILPPDRETLKDRLRKRSQDTEEVIQRRLHKATGEIENYDKYDYILVNDELEKSVNALKAIVLAERLKHSNKPRSAADIATLELAERNRLATVRDKVQAIIDSFKSASCQSATSLRSS